MLRLIARLAGFLGRKGDGDPGMQTISLGLQRVRGFAAGIKFAKAAHGL